MNDYEAKLEAKRQRYEERAARLRREADRRFGIARQIGDAIPFGQPILVGHHSEKRHRRDLDRIDRAMRAGIEATKTAAHYESKAASVGFGGISSDDPDAVAKLKVELAEAEAAHAKMIAANKLVRRKDRAGLAAMFPEKIADKLLTPDYCGRFGFPSYAISNNGANIRRIKDRIAQLEKAAARETKESAPVDGLRVVENAEANRVQLIFEGKPADEVRAKLKGFGFRWAPSEGAWQRHLNGNGIMYARIFIEWYTKEKASSPCAI